MSIITWIFSILTFSLNLSFEPFFWYRSRNKKIILPRLQNKILLLSASELAEKIRCKSITSEEVCTAYINRIKEVNGILNAVVEERFAKALAEARQVDKYVESSSFKLEDVRKIQPLLGVPVTIKESCSLAGHSFCIGSLTRQGMRADSDGEVVALLKSAGAIPLLITNTPEICLSWEAFNYVTGRTLNPYDTTRTSSGSSGGEGALLGAGASVVGVGSDVAGSIRLPAMFNGVFGHKPTPKLISIKGHYAATRTNINEYLVVGPLTRYAKDLTLMTRIMAGDNGKIARLHESVDLSGLNVFYMLDSGRPLPRVQNEIKDAIERSAEYLQTECRASSTRYDFSELADSTELSASIIMSKIDIPNLLKGGNHNLALEILKCLMGVSEFTFNLLFFYAIQTAMNTLVVSEDYVKAHSNLRRKFMNLLGDRGVFLYPTFPSSAFRHNESPFKIDSVPYLMIFNSLGLPATQVPCGLDKNGLPIGIQVIAAPNQDRLCLAVAEKLEKCFGGWIPPPMK